MNVTVVCDVLGAENNGTTIAAMNLIRALQKAGHQVRVVCPDPERRDEQNYYVAPVFNLGIFNSYVEKNGVRLARPSKRLLEQAMEGADVVHVMLPFALGHTAALLAREKGIPLTAGFHCQAENFTNHIFLMNARLANRLTYAYFYRRLYRWCDAIHYPTRFICDVFEGQVGPTTHYVISNGVNRDFHPMPQKKRPEWEKKFVVLSTGRYSREKAQEVLIDAVARSRYRDRIQLVLAGKGPREEFLRKRAERAGILPPVFGFYSRRELLEIIAAADLYVHPAVVEIEAIACLEAIACGKVPVIADSPRSATRYFALSEKNRFRPGDPEDLAAKMDGWLSDPTGREKCSRAYLGYAARFDHERCMDAMEAMLRDAAEGKCHAQEL